MQPNTPGTSNVAFECILAMPAYNEEGCIENVVTRWLEELRTHFGERCLCVVVNDGSRDQTGPILDRLAAGNPQIRVIHQANGGHGSALLHAYRQAVELNPAYVFQVDSDDQFSPADFGPMWRRRAESPFILGCRAKRQDAFHRLVITKILRLFLFMIYGRWLTDANVPFRLMTADFLRHALVVIPPAVFAPNIFLAVLAVRQGYDPLYLPVTHMERKTGKVSILRWKLVKVCFRCVGELWGFRATLAALDRAGFKQALQS